MKVAMVTRDLEYGIGTRVKTLVKELRKQGLDVDIYTGGSDFGTNLLLRRIKKDYDIFHVQGSCYGSFCRKHVPMVVTVHTLLKTEMKYEFRKEFVIGKIFEKLTLNNATKIIAVSDFVKEELISDYNIPEEKIVVIPNGVCTEEFDKIPSYSRHPPFVMSCGRDVARKNFSVLLSACRELGVECKIYHGELSRRELLIAYKKAAVFVCPSLYESFGYNVVEAMFSKCPVIVSDIPIFNKTLVFDGWNGLLFDPTNKNDLTEKIKYILSDQLLVKRFTTNAYNFVREYFNSVRMAKGVMKVYESIIN